MRLASRLLGLAAALALATPAAALAPLGFVDTPGIANDVALQGDLVFVADQAGGLRIIDASDPLLPVELASVQVAFPVQGVEAIPGYVLAAAGLSRLLVIDVSNPAAPGAPVTFVTPGLPEDVTVVGNLAYVADGFAGLTILDVTVPTAPTLVGALPGFSADHVRVQGGVAFVADNFATYVVDVSNPAVPVLLETLVSNSGDPVDAASLTPPYMLATDGSFYDVSDPQDPVALPSGDLQPRPGRRGLAGLGSLLFSADGPDGVRLHDFSAVVRPAPPGPLGGFGTGGTPIRDVRVANALVYLATGFAGLQVVDVSNAAAAALLGSLYVGDARALDVDGSLAYVGVAVDGVRIFDVSSPASPSFVHAVDTPGTPHAVVVEGDFAYVADGEAGLRILSIANPAAAWLAGGIGVPGIATDVAVAGNLAYVVSGDLRIFDVSVPIFPQLVATLPAEAHTIRLDGPLAYLGGDDSVEIVDVSNPASPVVVSTIPAGTRDLARRGSTLYLTSDAGISGWNVGNPLLPFQASFQPAAGQARVETFGLLLIATGTGGGFSVFDGNLPPGPGGTDLVPLAGFDTPGSAEAVAVDAARKLVLVADGSSGLRILDAAADLDAVQCVNGLDDDGDGQVDHPADPGCRDIGDPTERWDCDDGFDNDGDGLVDLGADPGCRTAGPGSIEDPACDDDFDNDGDGQTDFPADTLCQAAWDDDEASNGPSCGLLGLEALLPAALVARRRRRRA